MTILYGCMHGYKPVLSRLRKMTIVMDCYKAKLAHLLVVETKDCQCPSREFNTCTRKSQDQKLHMDLGVVSHGQLVLPISSQSQVLSYN